MPLTCQSISESALRGYVEFRGYETEAVLAEDGSKRVVGYEMIGPRGNRGFVPREPSGYSLFAARLWCDAADYADEQHAGRRPAPGVAAR